MSRTQVWFEPTGEKVIDTREGPITITQHQAHPVYRIDERVRTTANGDEVTVREERLRTLGTPTTPEELNRLDEQLGAMLNAITTTKTEDGITAEEALRRKTNRYQREAAEEAAIEETARLAGQSIHEYMQNHPIEKYEYLVRGAQLKCDQGSHRRRLNIPLDHAVYTTKKPMAHKMDCIPGDEHNIATFGVCSSSLRTNGPTVTLQAVRYEGEEPVSTGRNVKGRACIPKIVSAWLNSYAPTKITDNFSRVTNDAGLCLEEIMSAALEASEEDTWEQLENLVGSRPDDYNSITTASFLVCAHGGLIEPVTSGQSYVEPQEFENPHTNVNFNPLTGVGDPRSVSTATNPVIGSPVPESRGNVSDPPSSRIIPIVIDQTRNETFAASGDEHIFTFSIDLKREYNIIIEGTGFSVGSVEVQTPITRAWNDYASRYAGSNLRRTSSGSEILIAGIFTHGAGIEIGNGNYRIKLTSSRANVKYSIRLEMNQDTDTATGSDFNSAAWKPREIRGANRVSDLRTTERIFIAKESIPLFYLRVLDDSAVRAQSDYVSFLMSAATVYATGSATATRPAIVAAIRALSGSQRIAVAAGAMGVSTWALAAGIESLLPDMTLRGMLINDIRGKSGLVLPNTNDDREPKASHGLIIDQTFSLLNMTNPNLAATGSMTIFSRWDDFPSLAGARGWRDVDGFDMRKGGSRGNIHPVRIQLI